MAQSAEKYQACDDHARRKVRRLKRALAETERRVEQLVAEREQWTERLRDGEAKYRMLVENASEIIYTISPEGTFTFMSPAVAALGYDAAEVEGQPFERFVHPDDLLRCGEAILTLLASGGPLRGVECRVRHKDGGWRWFSSAGAVVCDDQGRPLYCVGIGEDVTDRKQADEALQAERQWLATLLDAIPAIVCLQGPDQRIRFANRAFRETFGDPEQQSCHELFRRRGVPCGQCPVAEVLADGQRRDWEWSSADGRTFLIHTTPVVDRDGRRLALQMMVDITARKAVEIELGQATQAARAASRAKSEFLANMSHELRTPMTAIMGYVELLREQCAPYAELRKHEVREHCDVVLRNAEHLLQVIDDILDISRLDAGKMRTETRAFNPRRLVNDVVGLMRLRAQEKGIRLDVRFDDRLPERVSTDPLRLRQVVMNLVGNAVKFTDCGGVRVEVSVERAPEGRGPDKQSLLRLAVADTGIGMTAEQMQTIFEPFTQADTSSQRRFGGTGLGLSISKRLVELLGGAISVTSEPGRGSTFVATVALGKLPPGDAAAAGEPRGAEAAGTGRLPLDGHTVLLAEDGPDNQRLIALLLNKAGAAVTVVDDGQAAIDAALAAPFDVVLMDMQMPVLDGYESTRRLRAAGYGGPIIALTAHALPGDREKCLAAGCDDYLAKPVDRGALLAFIAGHVAVKP